MTNFDDPTTRTSAAELLHNLQWEGGERSSAPVQVKKLAISYNTVVLVQCILS